MTTDLWKSPYLSPNVSFCSEEVIGFDISRPSSKHKLLREREANRGFVFLGLTVRVVNVTANDGYV